eukprot:CAMPEP_0206143776 /NCGR_PEP_ID=MMETSP1473-20131121/21770_1 /ASSEMBLY_ACC=CAM_ASM_001109 /TAXON_ID=1461547 /ORGANISM="Stichococcus sp, Strain RCC1054" /LENGTH=33 /DNA_ID= /DNA_START= /DNA_END= /DNA_ORIENTATION=
MPGQAAASGGAVRPVDSTGGRGQAAQRKAAANG